MKIKSTFSKRAIKTLLSITCFTFAFFGFIECSGQSIVGRWKGISVKNFYSAEYSKQVGKSMEEKSAKEIGNSDIEYKADHTFILNFTPPNSSDVTTMKGKWTLTGDQLSSTFEPQYNPRNKKTLATISIVGNTMVTTAEIAPPSRITKTISTGTRM